MNVQHLTDVYDYYKGGIISLLSPNLKEFRVIPLFTDQARWNDELIDIYAERLGVPSAAVLCRDEGFGPFKRHRDDYIQRLLASPRLPDSSDLFLDPDTGIAL